MSRRLTALIPFVLASTVSLARAETVATEAWSIESHDGFAVTARFHDAGERGPAVLLIHQCDRIGEATGLEGLARSLAARGIHAVEIDLRGYGGSISEAFDGKNWQEAQEHHAKDVGAVYRSLVSRSDVDPGKTTFLGASCGGRFAVDVAAGQPGARGIVFLSVGLGRSPAEFVDRVKGLPMFCIAAKDDPYGRAAESMRTACGTSTAPETRLRILEGTAHGAPLLDQEPELEPEIIGWLSDILD